MEPRASGRPFPAFAPASAGAVARPLAVLALVAALAAAAAPLAAQEGPPPLPPEVFAGQKPVTEADLDLAVDLIARGREGNATAADMETLAKRHKVEEPFRAAYVAARFGAGILMLRQGATPEQIQEFYGTPLAVPSDEELESIRAMLPRIEARLGLK
ncbi:MAG: hypothetical protein LBR80_18305 [Deltaproteobacteria bacterium]|jgi:hypothetical protein|nr:hypothetical protein [Deltaproteobacteria bacterium]